MANPARTMKVVRFDRPGPSGVLTVADVPVPSYNDDQVLVKIHSVGLNPVDALIRSGKIPGTEAVRIPGTDAAGVVEEVGSNVRDYKKGDRVAVYSHTADREYGTYAQYFVADSDMLFHLPEKLSFEDGASLGIPFLTAFYNIIVLGKAKAGQVVLVNGASGSAGLYAVDVAQTAGCKVIGTAGHDNGLKLIQEKGATAINYKDDKLVDKIKAAAGENGVNIVLETQPSNIPMDFEVLGKHGQIFLINFGKPMDKVDFSPMFFKLCTLRGTGCLLASPEEYKLMRKGLEEALKADTLKPIIQQVYKLHQVVQAHDEMEHSSRGSAGKLILDMSDVQ